MHCGFIQLPHGSRAGAARELVAQGLVTTELFLKELEKENLKLKRLLAELSLEKQILRDVAEVNF